MYPPRKVKSLRLLAPAVFGVICFGPMNEVVLRAEAANNSTVWTTGAGSWTDVAHWSDGLPTAIQRAKVHGNSRVLVPAGTYLAGDLEVGFDATDHARVEVDGGQLILMQDSLRVGEYSGGEGEFVLKDGALHCVMVVFVGGTDGVPGHATKGTVRIQGGNFLGRTLLTGVGWEAESLLAIEGSQPSAIHVLDYAYIQGFASRDGKPGLSTLSFTLDEHGVTPITIQWCILSEGLNFADHGFASLAGGNRVTWHHNLVAHNLSRNLRFQGPVDADVRNNLIYDWGETAAYGEFDRLNYVGNFLKAGPSTAQKPWLLFHNGDAVVMPGSLFVTNNILAGEHAAPGVNQDNWRGMGYYYERNIIAAAEPFPAPRVTTEPPKTAYGHVLKDAGAILPRRDAVDERIVREVRQATGHIVNWVKEAGGWPDFPSAAASSRNAK